MKNEKNSEIKGDCGCKKSEEASAEIHNCECGEDCGRDVEELADEMCQNEQAVNVSDLINRLDEASEAAEKNKDLYLRAMADLDTYRRKVQREKQELADFAVQPIIEELLPSIDHLEMAIDAAKKAGESENLILGVEMVCAQMKKVLSGFGVEEIAAEGKDFDPNFEEAVSHENSDKTEANKVIKIVRKGYMLKGRLLRPASVVVSSGKAKK